MRASLRREQPHARVVTHAGEEGARRAAQLGEGQHVFAGVRGADRAQRSTRASSGRSSRRSSACEPGQRLVLARDLLRAARRALASAARVTSSDAKPSWIASSAPIQRPRSRVRGTRPIADALFDRRGDARVGAGCGVERGAAGRPRAHQADGAQHAARRRRRPAAPEEGRSRIASSTAPSSTYGAHPHRRCDLRHRGVLVPARRARRRSRARRSSMRNARSPMEERDLRREIAAAVLEGRRREQEQRCARRQRRERRVPARRGGPEAVRLVHDDPVLTRIGADVRDSALRA